jgi:hypothetical protein
VGVLGNERENDRDEHNDCRITERDIAAPDERHCGTPRRGRLRSIQAELDIADAAWSHVSIIADTPLFGAPTVTDVANSFRPPEGSLLQRLFAARRRLPAGAFVCGLRSEDGGIPGVSRGWRYVTSWVDGDELVYGKRRRALRIHDPAPREDVTVRDGFVVLAAQDRATGARCEIAVADRDAYKLVQSALVDGPRP